MAGMFALQEILIVINAACMLPANFLKETIPKKLSYFSNDLISNQLVFKTIISAGKLTGNYHDYLVVLYSDPFSYAKQAFLKLKLDCNGNRVLSAHRF